MSRLEWGLESRELELGLDQGVLYLEEGAVPWNGLLNVVEDAKGAVETTHYFDGVSVHISQERGEDFTGTVEAYMYPKVFEEYNGYSKRELYKRFGLAYRTEYGDGYLLHLIYNARLSTNSRSWKTLGRNIDPSSFVWDISSDPVPIPGARPTSHLVIDTGAVEPVTQQILDILYGTPSTEPRMPTPEELVDIYESATTLRITQHLDGSYTAEGPDDMLVVNDDGTFDITAPSAYLIENGVFSVRSY